MTISKNQTLGQFNTTNADFILKGCEKYVKGKDVIDPCAGDGDLLEWSKKNGAKSATGYDIDPSKKSKHISHRDSLNNPPNYKGKYTVANPPFLAQNKNPVEKSKGDNSIYIKNQSDDLYKIAIQTMIDGNAGGGILIIPLGFLSSNRSRQIRYKFFRKYKIVHCKVFEMQVFEDTTYTVCVIVFTKDKKNIGEKALPVVFIPSGEEITFTVSRKHGWICGQEFDEFLNGVSTRGISRWEEKDTKSCTGKTKEERREKGVERGTVYVQDFEKGRRKGKEYYGAKSNAAFPLEALDDIILMHAIDSGSENGKIKLTNIKDRKLPCGHHHILLGKTSSRHLAHIRFTKKISKEIQLQIIDLVNEWLNEFREKYRSMFLTTFRNSVDGNSRKRIEFTQMYKLIAKAYLKLTKEYLDPKKEVSVFDCV